MFEQILCHLWGDYILQSEWMAINKVKKNETGDILKNATLWHVFFYMLPFVAVFRPSIWAYAAMAVTHYLIDRYRLARFVCYAKNWIQPVSDDIPGAPEGGSHFTRPTGSVDAGGFDPKTPPFLAFWLLIIVDNTIHLTINYLALRYL